MVTISPIFDKINKRIYSSKLKLGKIEEGALDENWYSEYKNLFRDDPQATPWITRLCLEYRKKDWGICNLRPVQPTSPKSHQEFASEISEMYIKPPKHMAEDNGYYIKCLCDVNAYGNWIKCVPFIMPNYYFGVCAQASVWIALKCLENKSGRNVKSAPIPEIQKAATGHYFSDYQGLAFENITRLLKMNSCESFVYDTSMESFKNFSFDELYNIIYAYVESGLPVILGVDVSKLEWWDDHEPGFHTIVLIGHTMNKESGEIDGFILHDQTKFPYIEIKKDDLEKAWDTTDQYKKEMGYSEDTTIQKAVVGVPPAVKAAYEEIILTHHIVLNDLYLKGNIDKRDYPIRPMLINTEQFVIGVTTAKFDDPSFGEFLMKRIKKIPFLHFRFRWIWALHLHEHEKKREEREVTGMALYDGITGKLILLFIENELVLYYDAKENQYKIDPYQ